MQSRLQKVATAILLADLYAGIDSLTLREDPLDRELTCRTFTVRADSVDEATRSVEAVIATDASVAVMDWRTWEVIDEVLVMDGLAIPGQVPLLANHDRWSLDSVLGSIRQMRTDAGQLIGRLFFADKDEQAEKAWNKVKQRHISDISAGYRAIEYTDIEPNQTAVVGGRSYTAGPRRKRITTRWEIREGSLVPIGADKATKIRGEGQTVSRKEPGVMNPKLKAFLVTLGLRADASDQEANEYYSKLSIGDKARADAAAAAQDGTRTELPLNPSGNPPSNPAPVNPPTPSQGGERNPPADTQLDRIRRINELAGDDVPRDLVARAQNENWTVERASTEFLGAVRGGRRPTGQPAPGPAVHSRSQEVDVTARSLAVGLLLSQGLNPTECRSYDGRHEGPVFTEQEAEQGHRLRALSAVDLARQCALIDTGRNILDYEEAIRTAVSGATMQHVFTTNVNARLIEGYERRGDTTGGWVDEEEVPNFLEQEDISLTATSGLEKLPRGGTAKDATASDKHETYKIARFARKFTVDEQDFIDDRLGAIMRMPMEMGEQAAELRPNLVYALLISNPSLVADSTAVFHTDHANLGTGVLNSANLKLAISAMGKQRENNRVLNITPMALIVPAALEWTGQELLSPAMIAKLFAGTGEYSTENLIARRALRLVMDDRLGTTGVMNPNNKNQLLAGLDTQWFLAAGGSKSIRCAYLRGSGRRPTLRQYVLDRGMWGFGWDIKFDIGAAFMDYRTFYKSSGTV